MQLASQGTRKEREEIEQLKREISRLTAEQETKNQKQRRELDRVKKVNVEVEGRNAELSSEVKVLQQKLLQYEQQIQQLQSQATKQSSSGGANAKQADSRYSFSTSTGQSMPVAQQRRTDSAAGTKTPNAASAIGQGALPKSAQAVAARIENVSDSESRE